MESYDCCAKKREKKKERMKTILFALPISIFIYAALGQQSLLLENEDKKPQTNLVSNVGEDIYVKLKVPGHATVTYAKDTTNQVLVQIFIIRDKSSGSREFYFDLKAAQEALAGHRANYRRVTPGLSEDAFVEFVGGKPLVFTNKTVDRFVLYDTCAGRHESFGTLESAIHEFNYQNSVYHGKDATAPVILKTIVYSGAKGQSTTDF